MIYRPLFILPLAVFFTGCAGSVKKPEPIVAPTLCQGSTAQRNLTVVWSKRHYWCGNQALPVFTEAPQNASEKPVSDARSSSRKNTRVKPSPLKNKQTRSKWAVFLDRILSLRIFRPPSARSKPQGIEAEEINKYRSARRKPTKVFAAGESTHHTVQRPVERTEGAPLASVSTASSSLLNASSIAPDARAKMAPRQGASLIQDQAPSVDAKAPVFKPEDKDNPIFVTEVDTTSPTVITFVSGVRMVGPSGRKKLASLMGSLDVNKPVWVVGHAGGQEDLGDQDAGTVATQRAESVRNHLLELGLKTPVEIKTPTQIQAGRYVKVGQE